MAHTAKGLTMSFAEDDADDDGSDAVVQQGAQMYSDIPPVALAWTILCYDPAASKIPMRLHRAAVACLVRTMDAHARDAPTTEGAGDA